VLKTRRSMRAVHFHPQGLPVVLTAEVQDPVPTPELPPTVTEEGSFVERGEDWAAGVGGPGAGAPSSTTAAGAAAAAAGGSGQAGLAGGPQRSRSGQLDLQSLALAGSLGGLHLSAGAEQRGTPAAAAAAPSDERQRAAGAAGWVPPGSQRLPPSMVPTGWELPFPSNLFSGSGQAGGGAGGGAAGNGSGSRGGGDDPSGWGSLPQVMAAFSAAAWNIIGEEQPPRVRLRLWK
jgi:activator-of-BECN1-regulated-autophagy protein 1